MKTLATLILVSICILSRSQNLLVNGSFEDLNTCTEYHVECAPEAWVSSSSGFTNYIKDRQRSHTGVNCMAIEAGNFQQHFRRTIIRSRLICGLRRGANYKLEFYIKSPHDMLDSAGIYFSAVDPLFDKTPLHKLTPSVYLERVIAPMKINDSAWHKVEITYAATGEERFITLGYFAKEDYLGDRVHPLENHYYIFFDDITMVPVDPNERLCNNWEQMKEEVYEENERHSLMEKKISYYKANPPLPPTIIRNAYVKIDTLVLPDILFATGKADLQPQSHALLDSFCRHIEKSKIDSIVVEGHTDSVGTYGLNEKLSLDRAIAVKSYLQEKTGYAQVTARGWAFLKPVTDNKTPQGRQRNRRVEVFLYVRE